LDAAILKTQERKALFLCQIHHPAFVASSPGGATGRFIEFRRWSDSDIALSRSARQSGSACSSKLSASANARPALLFNWNRVEIR
jgi:hypothetical protein